MQHPNNKERFCKEYGASVFSRLYYPELPDWAPDQVAADLKHIYTLHMKLILYV